MNNCFDVSKEFLRLAKEENVGIDTMKLLKLTYIAHGYSLGFFSKPLFYNQVQAWKYGPVIPELYHVIKRFSTGFVDINTIDLYSENELSSEDKHLLSKVWNAYKKFNGLQLSTKTHEPNTPWALVYNPNIDYRVIDNSIIEEYYKKMIDERRRAN
jgi:uncharacterized phage-associated protein